MNEQMLEQQGEEVLMVDVSDEALEAAAGNGLGPTSTYPGDPALPNPSLSVCR